MPAEKVITRCRLPGAVQRRTGTRSNAPSSPRRCAIVCGEGPGLDGKAAGMQVKIDPAGNLRGRYARGLRSTSIGDRFAPGPQSPTAEPSTAILGVMLGLALVESLNGERLPFSIELVAFSEEGKGVRFPSPLHRQPRL